MSQPLRNEVKIDSHGYPDSFSLTETDREYFNVIKTEDGQSRFFLTSGNDQVTESNVNKNKAQKHIITDDRKSEETESHQSFRYHIVQTKNSKPIVGIYLPENVN